jgi:transcriptional regulator with XRE-family HTH domain
MEHPEKEIKRIAKRIRKIRGKLSRETFGLMISESKSNIKNYEDGQYNRQHTIPVDVLIKISKVFHIPLRELIEDSDSEEK